jgi:hypothetical protein
MPPAQREGVSGYRTINNPVFCAYGGNQRLRPKGAAVLEGVLEERDFVNRIHRSVIDSFTNLVFNRILEYD